MKHGRFADFFFVGLGIVPVALMLGGLPHLAILLFAPLLFIACLFGMAEQAQDSAAASAPLSPGRDGGARPLPDEAADLAMRDRTPVDGHPKT